jgi:hypothetical protein
VRECVSRTITVQQARHDRQPGPSSATPGGVTDLGQTFLKDLVGDLGIRQLVAHLLVGLQGGIEPPRDGLVGSGRRRLVGIRQLARGLRCGRGGRLLSRLWSGRRTGLELRQFPPRARQVFP